MKGLQEEGTDTLTVGMSLSERCVYSSVEEGRVKNS